MSEKLWPLINLNLFVFCLYLLKIYQQSSQRLQSSNFCKRNEKNIILFDTCFLISIQSCILIECPIRNSNLERTLFNGQCLAKLFVNHQINCTFLVISKGQKISEGNCCFFNSIPQKNPNWHEGWYFYLLVIFGSDFVSWFFFKIFWRFLGGENWHQSD